MRLSFRVRRPEPAPPEKLALPAVNADRVLVALAVHAQQMSDRLERLEERIEDVAGSQLTLALPTHDDLHEVRTYSARLSAEMAQIAMELEARMDELTAQMPAAVVESRRQERARTLAETIIDLSDSLDTGTIDLRDGHDDWATTTAAPSATNGTNGHHPVNDAGAATGVAGGAEVESSERATTSVT